MNGLFDKAIGIHAQTLSLRSQRAGLLAENLANADTPNYKARDVDFGKMLADMQGSARVRMTATSEGHLGGAAVDNFQPMYRIPLHPSADGNTVTAHLEQSAFAENSVRYQASLMFLNRKLSGLKAAMGQE